MKILFFTESTEDYLSDSILHGFRKLFGKDCVDYPKCEILYNNCSEDIRKSVRGNGFTLYSGLLDDIEIDRHNITEKVKNNFFDLIVFGNIQRQYGLFLQYRPWLKSKNTVILDGDDTPYPYPARGFWWRKSYYWNLPRAHKNFLYFKREWTEETRFSIFSRFIPTSLKKFLPKIKNLRTISFSIPEEKITSQSLSKNKDFPKHIVDGEVSQNVRGSFTKYAFTSESDYYKDLQQSKFGITVKRAGWDCLRHYEIAANGAVICFKNLHNKPRNCAPHGLDETNSITYSSYEDLLKKTSALNHDAYSLLEENSIIWIKNNTTVKAAQKILFELKSL